MVIDAEWERAVCALAGQVRSPWMTEREHQRLLRRLEATAHQAAAAAQAAAAEAAAAEAAAAQAAIEAAAAAEATARAVAAAEQAERRRYKGKRTARARHYREQLAWRSLDPCVYCNGPRESWDHMDPKKRGGVNRPENLAPCCRRCNSRKHAKPLLVFLAQLRHERQT